jgi:protein-tyrosine phosphatase
MIRVKMIALLSAALLAGTAAPLAARQATAPAATQEAPTRLLPLEGGQNFRDIGGYRTADGRTVKWGTVFRSGTMTKLTDADFRYLAGKGLKTVVDLRSTSERKKEPVAWTLPGAPQVHQKDYEIDYSMMASLAKPGLTGAEARAVMASFYREVPKTFAEQYRVIFAELLGGDTPLAFNCSAGKDRTGVAAALLLTVLGVPRETVIADYLLSNETFKPVESEADKNDPQMMFFARLPADVRQALMGVDRSYIEAAFATIDGWPGGAEAYYRDQLGLDAKAIAALRDKMLVRTPA